MGANRFEKEGWHCARNTFCLSLSFFVCEKLPRMKGAKGGKATGTVISFRLNLAYNANGLL